MGEAYSNEGKYTASIKAFDRALEIEPKLLIAWHCRSDVNLMLAHFEEAVTGFKYVISNTNDADPNSSLPSTKCLIETYLAYSTELYQQTAYGGCLEVLMEAIRLCMGVLDSNIRPHCFLKLLGDCCILINRFVPQLINDTEMILLLDILNSLIRQYEQAFIGLPDIKVRKALSSLLPLECASVAYQAAIVVSKKSLANSHKVVAQYYNDLAISCYLRSLLSSDVTLISSAVAFMITSLRHDPSAEYFTNMGVLTFKSDPKVCQHSFVRAAEYDPQVLVFN